jgi:hypothetical protein
MKSGIKNLKNIEITRIIIVKESVLIKTIVEEDVHIMIILTFVIVIKSLQVYEYIY